MNFLKTSIAIFAFVFCANVSYGFEFDITTLCKHPTKDLLFVGGIFNTVLVVDSKTGATHYQLDLDYHVEDMELTQNGMELMIFDGKKVHFIDAETGAESRSFGAMSVRFFERAPYFTDFSWMQNTLKIYSTVDGELVGKIQFDATISDTGFSPDFSELLVLSRDHAIENESSLIVEKVEEVEGYSSFNRAFLKQQADGKGSTFSVYSVPTMEPKLSITLPYYTDNNFDLTLSKFGNEYYLSCWDMLIRVNAEGQAFPLQPDEASFTMTSGVSLDGKHLILASSENGTLFDCEKKQSLHFDNSEEFMPPRTRDVTFTPENIYFISNDYTLITMNYLGQSVLRKRVQETPGGVGVYYYNGKEAGEGRDEEAAIINDALTENNQPTVNLNDFDHRKYVLLGSFKSFKEADEFTSLLKDNKLFHFTYLAPLKKD